MKATCGLAHKIKVTATTRGIQEQWIYQNIDGSPLLLIYRENGIVTLVLAVERTGGNVAIPNLPTKAVK